MQDGGNLIQHSAGQEDDNHIVLEVPLTSVLKHTTKQSPGMGATSFYINQKFLINYLK
jgi:hypothetical protein